jgi:hypothetical protein
LDRFREAFYEALDDLRQRYGPLERREFTDPDDATRVHWVEPAKAIAREGRTIGWALAMNTFGLYVFSFIDGEQDELAYFEIDAHGALVKQWHTREISSDSDPSLADSVAMRFGRCFRLPKLSASELN